MSLRNYPRFPWLDLWMVPIMALIAWAAFRLGSAEVESSQNDDYLRQIAQAFAEYQKWMSENAAEREGQRRESAAQLQEAMVLRDEYATVAERLESSAPELTKALETRVALKKSAERLAAAQELRAWIEKENNRVSLERLDSKSKKLKERLETTPRSGQTAPLRISDDLESLMAEIDRACQRYSRDLQSLADNQGKPLVGAFLAARADSARQSVERLGELAQQTRQDAQAIQSVIDAGPRSEGTPENRRQQEIAETFIRSSSPAEFVRRIERGDGRPSAPVASFTTSALREARYGLLAALAALAAFLMVDVYRRVVVSPLRFKLVEREGLIEHQKKIAHFEELAAGLAHEIRNPLTAISARLYTIQRKLKEASPEFQDAVVIGSEIERANHILKEFIQVTRPAPPKLELITAGLLLENVSQLMTPQLERQDVKLQVQLPVRTRFYGDQQQLKQVLVNLVQNAADSMEGGGAVILRAREERVPFKGSLTRAAIIEVEDNGPGIRPEVQDRLFEPFFSTKKEGTGLGLPISARIIDRHGGTLDFESQPQHGTIFRIVLPSYEQ